MRERDDEMCIEVTGMGYRGLFGDGETACLKGLLIDWRLLLRMLVKSTHLRTASSLET